MDKIAGKIIGSQDIIRANAQAEAMEAERTKQEAEQYRAQLEELRAGEKEHKKAIDEANETLAALSKRIDDNETKIHDVGVQVYRNVQAVVEKGQEEEMEQFKALGDLIEGSHVDVSDLVKRLDKIDEAQKELESKLETLQVGVETKNSAVTPLVIITMLIAAAGLAFNILVRLGII
jgi:chromosome segregation ATPase